MRKASTEASLSAAKKRESAEREGNRSRRNLRHERGGEWLEPLVKLLQGAFGADGVAEENGKKVDDIVAPKAPSGKAHLLSDLAQDTLLAEISADHHDFAKPARG